MTDRRPAHYVAQLDSASLALGGGTAVGVDTPPTVSTTGASDKPWRFVLIWALAWAVIGLAVGLVIAVVQMSLAEKRLIVADLFGPATKLSVLFAEVVGLTALSASRLIFPYYASLPYIPRLLLQLGTVGGGALFGTIVVALMFPLYTVHEFRMVLTMVVVNASLALVVGIAVHTYETMKRQLERSYVDLRKKEAFDREMEIAREVQEQLFPKSVPTVRGLEIAGICLPAAGVGGDYFDYLALTEDRLGLVVADVSGKGISAALLMASLHASVRNVIGPTTTPREANLRLNEFLYASTTASRYATMFLCLFDGRDGTLSYSNAGHNPPVVLGSAGPVKLTAGGLPLGIMKSVRYAEDRQTLEPGDLLLLYTDGAVEASDRAGREFGLDRLVEVLARNRNGTSLEETIGNMVSEVRAWSQGQPQQDDITIVLARAVDRA